MRMTSEDDLTRQVDELSALAAIYSSDWCVVDEMHRIYCISVTEDEWKITIQVHLPETYPSSSSPEVQIHAPWLRNEERVVLESGLLSVCRENDGECILHLLVEKVRQHLLDRDCNEKAESVVGSSLESWLSLDEEGNGSAEHSAALSLPETEIEIPEILHGEPFTDRKSTFQGHIAYPVVSVSQVKLVVRKLYENRKIANATHNIMAYRIEVPSTGAFLQDFDDDGETLAAARVLHLLQMADARNVVVIVSRWFGGILLHQDRFKHISNAARNMLELTGFIDNKDKGKNKKVKSKRKP